MKTQDNVQTGHTPWPWTVENVGNCATRSGRCIIVDADDHLVATLADLSEASYINARLMAAAPELINLLSQFVDKVAQWPEGANPEFLPYMKGARALLAKVRG